MVHDSCIKAFSDKAKEQNWKEKKKQMKEVLLTLSDYESLARQVFQRWIRKRDENEKCISCDTKMTELWDGGHFLKAEIYSGLIFEPTNCHKQCRKCNRFLNGNELNYRHGLIARYGEEYVLNLENKRHEARQYKFTKNELIFIRDKYLKLLK